jgi:lipoate-protein ligase B
VKIDHLGRVSYGEAHAHMLEVLTARISETAPDTLVLCEHEPVFTVGRRYRGDPLDAAGAPVVLVERGGEVTFHGPGQLVGYPVFRLARPDLHGFLRGLEAALIASLARFAVTGARDARNTGVWVEGRKIAAIGIACRQWVTWHGFALNVATDLRWFQRIRPCGLDPLLVTRLADHVEPCPALEEVGKVVGEEVGRWWENDKRPDTSARRGALHA